MDYHSWTSKSTHPTDGRIIVGVDQNLKVVLLNENAGEGPISFPRRSWPRKSDVSGRTKGLDTAENVSGIGYRSRNRRQVHLDVATLQGAIIAIA